MGNSGCLLCWPRQVQSSFRVVKESWGLLSSDCRANTPHLGWCPEANVPLQGRQGSRGCIPDAPGETGIHLEWKQRTPLCSRIATGTSDYIYIKLFKNMPRSDVEMIFPNTKFGVSAGGGVGMGVFGTVSKLAMLSNPYTLAGAVAGLGGIALRQATNF